MGGGEGERGVILLLGLENDIDVWQIDGALFIFCIGEGRQNTLDPGMNDFEDADKITISVSNSILKIRICLDYLSEFLLFMFQQLNTLMKLCFKLENDSVADNFWNFKLAS